MTFRIRLVPGGQTFEARAGESVLDAALRAGIALPHDCRRGRCRTCVGTVLDGRIHRGDAGRGVLTDSEQAKNRALLCQARPLTDLVVEAQPVAALAGIVVRNLTVRVDRIERLAPTVVRLALRLPGGTPFRFLPGQHVDVLLRDGRRRSYSIANPPDEQDLLELHVREVPGGAFSGERLAVLRTRDLLRIQGPFGTFVFDDTSPRPAVLLAGGTGYAPLRSMLRHLAQSGTARALHLYRGVRSRDDLYLSEESRQFSAALPKFRYTPVVEEGDGRAPPSGLASRAVVDDYPDLSGLSVYASGPPAMIVQARAAFTAHGLPAPHFHSDAFEPAPG